MKNKSIQTDELTFRKVERSIRRSKNIDSSIIDLLDELRGVMGDNKWREMPINDIRANEFIELFVQNRIIKGYLVVPHKKLESLLFIIDSANEIQLKHGKDPALQSIKKDCEKVLYGLI